MPNTTSAAQSSIRDNLKSLWLKGVLSVGSQLAPGESPIAKDMMWHGIWGGGRPYKLDLNEIGAGISENMYPIKDEWNQRLGEWPDVLEQRGGTYSGLIRGTKPNATGGNQIDLHNALGTFTGRITPDKEHGYNIQGYDKYDFHKSRANNDYPITSIQFKVPPVIDKLYRRLLGNSARNIPTLGGISMEPTVSGYKPGDPTNKYTLNLPDSVFEKIITPYNVEVTGRNIPLTNDMWQNKSALAKHMQHYSKLYLTGGAIGLGSAAMYALYKSLNRNKKGEDDEQKN